jgi:hypothetical protein
LIVFFSHTAALQRPGSWREAADAWITDALADQGIGVTGPIEQARVRFWSIHLIVPTDVGRFWFKENCPGQAFEARLVEALLSVAPDRITEVTATSAKNGWLLTPDQGSSLWDAGQMGEASFRRLLVDYASLQRAIMASDLDLTACGLTTMDPAAAANYVADQVSRLNDLLPGDPGRLDDDTAARLRALLPTVRRWAEQVAATGLPLTLEHSDLHPGNAFDPPGSGSLRLFDFSDAVRAFPLCSLLVPIRVMTSTEEPMPGLDQAAVARVVDAYLEVFSDLAPMTELRGALTAALELAKLNRHESWRRALVGADATSYAESGDAPAAWLGMLGRSD